MSALELAGFYFRRQSKNLLTYLCWSHYRIFLQIIQQLWVSKL